MRLASVVALSVLALSAHGRDSCEVRGNFAHIGAKEAGRMELAVLLQGLRDHVQAHPEQWTTLDIQMAVRAMIFGYTFPGTPEQARGLEEVQCEKEKEV